MHAGRQVRPSQPGTLAQVQEQGTSYVQADFRLTP